MLFSHPGSAVFVGTVLDLQASDVGDNAVGFVGHNGGVLDADGATADLSRLLTAQR